MEWTFRNKKWWMLVVLLLCVAVTAFAYREGYEVKDEEDNELEDSKVLPRESKKIAKESGGMIIERHVNGYPMLFWTFAIGDQTVDYFTVDFGGGTEVEIDEIHFLDLELVSRYHKKLKLGTWDNPRIKNSK